MPGNTSGSAPAQPMATPAPGPPGPVILSQTSGKAIASLILGLFAFFFPAAILAIVFGHISLSEIKKSVGHLGGRGLAIAGLVLGYLGIAMLPVILIIAAIAIPNLLRARIVANEVSAVNDVRRLVTGEITYATEHPNAGYSCNLPDLADSVEADLTGGNRHGYVFVLQNCAAESASGPNTKFQVLAYPQTLNQTGVRAFCADESAVIKFDSTGSAQDCVDQGRPLQPASD